MSYKQFVESKSPKMLFVRYGGLSPVKQHGYGEDKFHSPPARYGFYAMPFYAQEHFLLSGKHTTKKTTWKVKDKHGKPVTDRTHPELFAAYKRKSEQRDEHYGWSGNKLGVEQPVPDGPSYIVRYRQLSPKKFTYSGALWHHLDGAVATATHNDWYKSTMHEYLKAFQREIKELHVHKYVRGQFGCTQDHMEVFIERL